MSINRRPLHLLYTSLFLLIVVGFCRQTGGEKLDELPTEDIAEDSLLLVREDGHEPLPVGQGGTLLRRVGYLTSSNLITIVYQILTNTRKR